MLQILSTSNETSTGTELVQNGNFSQLGADLIENGLFDELGTDVITNGGFTGVTELVVNGDFATDTGWTKDSGWTISGGVAIHNGADGAIWQTSASVINGKTYKVSLTAINVTAGTLYPHIAGTNSFVEITESGDYSFYVVAGSAYR